MRSFIIESIQCIDREGMEKGHKKRGTEFWSESEKKTRVYRSGKEIVLKSQKLIQ